MRKDPKNCAKLSHFSQLAQMNTTTWLKLKHRGNPNQYALDMWRSKDNTALKDRVEALQAIQLTEFKEIGVAILDKYNLRNASQWMEFKLVDPCTVLEEDVAIMDQVLDKLQQVVSSKAALAEIALATISALDLLSPLEIMRVSINTLLWVQNHPNQPAPHSREIVEAFLQTTPSFEDVQRLGMSPENLEAYVTALGIVKPVSQTNV